MSKKKPPVDIAIIGGGISGLSAAYHIQKYSSDCNVSLFEKNTYLGGVIRTSFQQGFLIEHGPDAYLNQPIMEALAAELNLGDSIISTQPKHRQSYIVKNKKPMPIPKGFYLLAPLKTWPFLASKSLSLKTKLRTLAEPWMPKANLQDESLSDFVTRRFGKGNLEEISQAMIAGIYTADPKSLSMHATFPKFIAYEKKYGSVLKGIRENIQGTHIRGPRYGKFRSFKNGMATLTEALTQKINPKSIHLQTKIKTIQCDKNRWVLSTENKQYACDHLILAIPPFKITQLMSCIFPEKLKNNLNSIPFASSAIVYLGYDRTAFDYQKIKATGFIVPNNENISIFASTFSSEKFECRSDDDQVLIRVFFGGVLKSYQNKASDSQLIAWATQDIQTLLKPKTYPHYTKVIRWPDAMPQYNMGHLTRIEAIKTHMAQNFPNLSLLGNAYTGVGIPHLIETSKKTAQHLLL